MSSSAVARLAALPPALLPSALLLGVLLDWAFWLGLLALISITVALKISAAPINSRGPKTSLAISQADPSPKMTSVISKIPARPGANNVMGQMVIIRMGGIISAISTDVGTLRTRASGVGTLPKLPPAITRIMIVQTAPPRTNDDA